MGKIFTKTKDMLNSKWLEIFLYLVATVMLVLSNIVPYDKIHFVFGGVTILIVSFFIARLAKLRVKLLVSDEVIKTYAKNYDDISTRCDRVVASYKQYENEFDSLVVAMEEGGDILPSEQAILSQLRLNAVKGSTAKSMFDFYKDITHSDTVFLIKLDHARAHWHIKVTGRRIQLNQAKYVMERSLDKIKDFAESDSLVRKPIKIIN
jgi:hypothetical protein